MAIESVHTGDLTKGWTLISHVDCDAGVLSISATTTDRTLSPSGRWGTLFWIDLTIATDALPGPLPLNLRSSYQTPNNHYNHFDGGT